MRQFIIREDVLGAVAQCIGAATHGVPYGQVAALVARLDSLPEVQPGQPDKAKANEPAPEGARQASEGAAAGSTETTPPTAKPGAARRAAPQAKNV